MDLKSQNIVVYRVGDLPGSTQLVDLRTEGRVVAETFRNNPNLPGVILCEGEEVRACLSHQEFLRHMSRPFGMEVYLPRPIEVLVQHARLEMLVLDADLSVEDAVTQCLQRSEERLYEPFIVRDERSREARLIDCQTLFLALSSTASLRATQMGRILQAVPIGLMLFDQSGTISPEYSEHLPRILEQEVLGGRKIDAVLGELLDPGALSKFHDYFGVLFNQKLIDRLIKGINPISQVAVLFGSANGATPREKHLAFSFERVRAGSDIAFILAMVEDRTRRVMMDEEIRHREDSAERRLRAVVQMMGLDREQTGSFLDRTERLAIQGQSAAEAIARRDPDARDQTVQLFRDAHALKGEAGLLGLEAFQEQIHTFETPLRATPLSARDIEDAVDKLRTFLSQAQEGAAMLQRMARARTAAATGHGFLQAIGRLATQTAGREGKRVAFHARVAENEIEPSHVPVLRDVLQQLVRNSVVHGVEAPDERVAAGKPEMASLQFAARDRGHLIEYVFQDDGRGIAADDVARRAGLPEGTNRNDVLKAIFNAGLTTADGTGLDAGRGIGLDMVRATIEQAGGSISAHDEPGKFCAFRILLPAGHEGKS